MTEQTMDQADSVSVDAPVDDTESGTSSEETPLELRPLTQAEDLRAGVASKIFDVMGNADGGLPLKTVEETAGRSILLEFADDSRLLIQITAISAEAELSFRGHDDEE